MATRHRAYSLIIRNEDIRSSCGNVQRHPLFNRAVLHRESKMKKLRQLYEVGANFIVASDSGSRANPHHSAAAREVHFLVKEVDLSPMEAIMAATRWVAVVLQKQNELGRITEGKLADIIVIDGDPLEYPGDLRHVINVVKGGVQICRIAGTANDTLISRQSLDNQGITRASTAARIFLQCSSIN